MKIAGCYPLTLCAALALPAGCSGSQGALSLPAAGPALLARLAQGTGEVQYFSNDYSTLLEFDYPKSESSIGSISFSAGDFCTKGARTFWVVTSNEIAEFKVGGKTPTRVLEASASACAVDPATGDLAAPTMGGVIIFHKARGKGKFIKGPGSFEPYFDGYDNKSDLFVDGFFGDAYGLVGLKKRSDKFESITLSNTVLFPGSVQWDGKYLTITDQEAKAIYQYTISGTKATLKGTVSLTGAADCAQTWIARPYVYCADAGNNDGEVFKYPAGGQAIAVLQGNFDLPLGVVSLRAR